MILFVKCEYCGKEFIPSRITAKYCCDSHKTLACRERRKLEKNQHEWQLQQEEIEKFRRGIEEEKRKKDEQALALEIERKKVVEMALFLQNEKRLKDEKQKRIEQYQKRKIEREKKSKQAHMDLKIKVIGGLTALGVLSLFLDSKPEQERLLISSHAKDKDPVIPNNNQENKPN